MSSFIRIEIKIDSFLQRMIIFLICIVSFDVIVLFLIRFGLFDGRYRLGLGQREAQTEGDGNGNGDQTEDEEQEQALFLEASRPREAPHVAPDVARSRNGPLEFEIVLRLLEFVHEEHSVQIVIE